MSIEFNRCLYKYFLLNKIGSSRVLHFQDNKFRMNAFGVQDKSWFFTSIEFNRFV